MAADTLVSIRLSTEQLERAQRLADKAGITRHKLIHNLVVTGIDTLEDLNAVGIFGAALAFRNIEDYFKSLRKSKKDQEA
jgi:predicted DNA-binding protein